MPRARFPARKILTGEFNTDELALKISEKPGRGEFGGRRFRFSLPMELMKQFRLPRKEFGSPLAALREVFDADKIGGEIVLRHWQPGDRFQPIGLKSAVKLQDLFVNAKVPSLRRRELVLAATRAGQIFWVEGLRIGEQFKRDPGHPAKTGMAAKISKKTCCNLMCK